MSKVVVTLEHDWRKIAELAGGDPSLIMYDPPTSELEVPDVTQGALDTAFETYTADQVNIDAAKNALQRQRQKTKATDGLDTNHLLLGIVELMVDEINILRKAAGITPKRTLAQYKNQIKIRIGRQ